MLPFLTSIYWVILQRSRYRGNGLDKHVLDIEAFLLLLFPSSPIPILSLSILAFLFSSFFFLSLFICLLVCLFVSLLFLFISDSSTGDGNNVETHIKSTAVSDHSPMNKFAMKTSDSNNDRILTGEALNQESTAKPDGIAMNSKAHINKEEEDASAAEEDVILDTEGKRVSSEYQKIQSPSFSTKGAVN